MIQANISTHIHVHCPTCKEEDGRVDHLVMDRARRPYRFGPWFCKSCGYGYEGEIREGDVIYVRPTFEQHTRTLSLLVLEPEDAPVYFVVEGFRSNIRRYANQDDDEQNRYLYEQHSCPTNFIQCEAIIADGDPDPHGIFKYIRMVDHPDVFDADDRSPGDSDEYEVLQRLFPEAFPEENA